MNGGEREGNGSMSVSSSSGHVQIHEFGQNPTVYSSDLKSEWTWIDTALTVLTLGLYLLIRPCFCWKKHPTESSLEGRASTPISSPSEDSTDSQTFFTPMKRLHSLTKEKVEHLRLQLAGQASRANSIQELQALLPRINRLKPHGYPYDHVMKRYNARMDELRG